MWTAAITDQHYIADQLSITATVADDQGAPSFTVSRTIAPGTVSSSDELLALIAEFAQSAADRMNAFDGEIVQPALAQLAPQIAANVAAVQASQPFPIIKSTPPQPALK